ncbi:MAG: NAD-dependent epimerase/dehydratase family protein [Prolixibacteraceae bacterium]
MEKEYRILITGASGFIGDFLVQEALKRNYNVYVFVRKTTNVEQLEKYPLTIVEVDFSSHIDLMEKIDALPRFDYVIHNAGLTRAIYNQDFFNVNVETTKNLIKALKAVNKSPDKFLFVSSLAACGPSNSMQLLDLNTNPNPVSAYGKSKLLAEQFIQTVAEIPYIIFRPTAVYGPGDKDFLQTIRLNKKGFDFEMGNEAQHLTFIYVKDFTRLVFEAMESKFINKIYLATDGAVYQKTDLGIIVSKKLHKKVKVLTIPVWIAKIVAAIAEIVGRITKRPSILRIDKISELAAYNWNCDLQPIYTDLNFSSKYKLKEGMQETIDWYKNKGWL